MRLYYCNNYIPSFRCPIRETPPGRGRVSKGDVLLTSSPFVYLLSGTLKGIYCDYCFKKKSKKDLQRCPGCQAECYCDRGCQVGAWDDLHQYECARLRRLPPTSRPPDPVRLLARVILKLQNGGDKIEEKITEKQSRKFKDLMNHYSDLKDDKRRMQQLEEMVEELQQYLGEAALPNLADLQGVFGRVCVNNFRITDAEMNSIGTAVYLAASVFDHSCQPNAYVTFDGTRLTCRALVDMPALDFSKIRISYIDVLNSRTERLNELHERYYFWCDCNFCHDPEQERLASSINCADRSCPGPVPIDECEGDLEAPIGPCATCGMVYTNPNTRHKYYTTVSYTTLQLDTMKDRYYLDTCQRALEHQGDLFHKLNLLRVRILDAGFEAALSVQNWYTALDYGARNLDGIKHYYGTDHPSVGLTLLKLGRACSQVYQRVEEGVGYLKEAQNIIKVSHGPSHPTYTHDLMPLLTQLQEELQARTTKKMKSNSMLRASVAAAWRTTCG